VLQYLEVSPARLSPNYLLLLDKADDLHFGTTGRAFEGIYLPDVLNTLPPGRWWNLPVFIAGNTYQSVATPGRSVLWW
jgi:hypothetical protein